MRPLFIILFFVLFSSLGFAQDSDQQEYAYLKIKTGEETITYEFDSVIDFNENTEKILNEITVSHPTNKKEKEPLLTIEISFTITSKNESSTITGSITAAHSSIIASAKKLQTQLLAIAIG
ncbi:hypothetical protein WMW71_01015 [Flavobacterium buctense]|uniref:Uncharacterized protein n=1 Tax=Flavobacterium buctense TaxID=1648146 RepID=A0ABU9DZ09_9FLAO|nr:hypothetical protein [Flavobacterium buctense]